MNFSPKLLIKSIDKEEAKISFKPTTNVNNVPVIKSKINKDKNES